MTPSSLRRLALVALLLFVSSTAVATPAAAQLRDLRMVSVEGAQRALAAASAEARAKGWAVSIAVVDPSGELVAFARLDGAPYSSIDIALGKARTAARFRNRTRGLDSSLSAGRYAILGLPGAVPVEGGVPITIAGQVVGAVGVSGVSSANDALIATAGAAAVQP